MGQRQVELQGTLQPDGTVVLDRRPDLSPGRVKVVLEAMPHAEARPNEGLVEYVMRIRRESEARSYSLLNDQEVTAWVEELRAEDDRIERAYRRDE
jgi:hypothetical protein